MADPLNITKVAVGCAELEALCARMAARAEAGEAYVPTRYQPKRHAELIGGSLFWIIKHRLVARQAILGFADDPDGRRIRIRLSDTIVPVRAVPKRAHQGWRYLAAADAPADLDGTETDGLAELPPRIAAALSALALI